MLARRMDAREHPEADDALQSVSRTFAACDSAVPKASLAEGLFLGLIFPLLSCLQSCSISSGGGSMPHPWG